VAACRGSALSGALCSTTTTTTITTTTTASVVVVVELFKYSFVVHFVCIFSVCTVFCPSSFVFYVAMFVVGHLAVDSAC
jgi:hypothetical protein